MPPDGQGSATTTTYLESVTFDVADPVMTAAFWAVLLEREVVPEPGAALLPGDATQVGLRFARSTSRRVGRPRLHLHLTSTSLEDQQRIVESALRLGGRRLDVGQSVEDPFVVLADPDGNELCVIEPANGFLRDTGNLGEVTCDGSRTAGRFWRVVLGWRQVWDENDQVAIQSPLGGTKISWDRWGRPEARSSPAGQRFDLVTDDLTGETQRFVSLGATLLARRPDQAELTDPDGHVFRLHSR